MMNTSEKQAANMLRCWSDQSAYKPIEVVRTEGCYLITKDGRRIFDLRSAHETNNLGFNNPRVLAAMKKQMDKVIYVTDDFATEATAELAEKLCNLVPGKPGKKLWFGQSGASAIEAAIKIARFYSYNNMMKNGIKWLDGSKLYPYPYKIISRYRSWHGATTGAASVSGDPRRWFGEPFNMPGVVFAPDAYCYRPMVKGKSDSVMSAEDCAEASADYMEQIIEFEGGSGHVSAVIIETVVGSNGIIPPPANYIKRIREICDKSNLLLICDETMTGMGRTGKFFSFEHYEIEPDIVVVGKALGAYCPISAVIMQEHVAKTFDDNIFGHGQSFSGHALACSAALESIRILEEDQLLTHVTEMGNYIGQRLHQIAKNHPSVGDVRGLGMFWTIELVEDKITKKPLRKFTQKYDHTVVSDIAEFLLNKKNIYIPSDKFGIWFVPPLVATKEEIDYVLDAIDEALKLSDMNSWKPSH
jgi:taurine--2-oxoglutarate transaminase